MYQVLSNLDSEIVRLFDVANTSKYLHPLSILLLGAGFQTESRETKVNEN
jgi:hypothetical protein